MYDYVKGHTWVNLSKSENLRKVESVFGIDDQWPDDDDVW